MELFTSLFRPYHSKLAFKLYSIFVSNNDYGICRRSAGSMMKCQRREENEHLVRKLLLKQIQQTMPMEYADEVQEV
jgi:hypothetical protein